MKRLVFSIGVFAVVALVSGAAFAQFTQTTISAIQDGSGGFTTGATTDDGDPLEITGIVSAVGGGGNSFYAQDAGTTYAGIRVYPAGVDVSALAIGDEVTVQGNLIEYLEETEIDCGGTTNPGSVTINSSGNTVYDPIVITGADFVWNQTSDTLPAEQYEGVLVTINNVVITDNSTPGYGMVDGTDDGGTTTARFDDDFIYNQVVTLLQVGQTYNITGVARYSYGDYKINPRSTADIQSIIPDTTAPGLDYAEAVSVDMVQAVFNEIMGATGLTTVGNYDIDGSITPSLVTVDAGGSSVTLTLPSALSSGTVYTLTVQNVVDEADNTINSASNSATFSFTIPPVTINEVMYDSKASGTDPDREWVELHNTTTSPIDISGWMLTDGEGKLFMPAGTIIPATGYLVVSASDNVRIPTALYIQSVSGSFVLNNDGDGLALLNDVGAIIDGATEILFPDLALSNVGDSIEKINEDFPYSGSAAAWRAATVPALVNQSQYRYASPGRMNNTTPSSTGLNDWIMYR